MIEDQPPLAQRLEAAAADHIDWRKRRSKEEIESLLNEAAKELRNAETIIIDHLANQGCMDQAFTWQLRVCGEPEKKIARTVCGKATEYTEQPEPTPLKHGIRCWGSDCEELVNDGGLFCSKCESTTKDGREHGKDFL